MNIPFQPFVQWGPNHGPHGPMGPDWVVRTGLAPWSNAGADGLGLLLPLVWLVLVGLFVIGALYLVGTTGRTGGTDRALDVVRNRYARGEITDEEFDTRTARLREDTDRNSAS